jgi:hypothetical protein
MAQRSNAGGGYGSRQVTHREAYKTEPKPRAVNPAGATQLGAAQGNHSTVAQGPMKKQGASVPLYRGAGYSEPVGPTKAECCVGGGRTVHKTGTQSQHGPASGQRPSPGRPIDGPTPFANRKEY